MAQFFKKITSWSYNHIVFGSLFALIAFLLILMFLSFNPRDASWLFFSTQKMPITNLLGSFGAHIASICFYAFGFSSWTIVFLVGYIAYLFFKNMSFAKEWDRLLSLALLPLTCSALCYSYSFSFFANVAPGGVFGAALYAMLVRWFEPLGATLFLHSLLFIHSIMIARSFFVRFLYAIGATVRFLFNREKFLRPAYAMTKRGAYIISVPFVFCARFLRRLFSGADITESDLSVVSFEQHLLEEVEDEDLSSSFWQDYVQADTSDHQAKEPAKTGAYSTAKDTEDISAIKEKESATISMGATKTEQEKRSTQKAYQLPHDSMFRKDDTFADDQQAMSELEKRAKILEEKLERFGVYGSVVSIKRGPVVTLFEYQPQIDSKISKIIALEDDLALALQALSIRIIAPIPGKSVVGFEVANLQRKDVLLSSIIHSSSFEKFSGSIPLVLGQDTVGKEVIVDLAKMPHLLIAGSTGSGKSVALNTFLVSMLCKRTPDELKLILVDPKRLEFASYADIPHLLFPIVTDPKRTAPILRWLVGQMESRYEQMSQVGSRNIFDYNAHASSDASIDPLPFIVLVIDELSDLMMTAGRDIEDLIARIAQMARAAGIHMIVATQRPSVDVITGLIKVNFPSRVSFRVTSKVDSRTILDHCGAEKLLGSGDMLFSDSGSAMLKRLHGAYVSNREIEALAKHVRAQRPVEYLDLTAELMDDNAELSDAEDALLEDVLCFLDTVDEVSISLLQRKFRIGYNRSARIIDMLESRGVVMPSEGSKMRKVIR